MPSHRGITIKLQSQFDALLIPEHAPYVNEREDKTSASAPKTTIHTEIPCYPGSRFWIVYSCPPPVPAHLCDTSLPPSTLPPPPDLIREVDGQQVKYYYFKLYITGISEATVSWGIGADQDWQGKVGHGFFDAGRDFRGKRVVEKKGLFFPGLEEPGSAGKGQTAEDNQAFEVQVFRAKGRIQDKVGYSPGLNLTGSAVRMSSVGLRKQGEPKRMYTYALLDPLDEPYAVFRYAIERWWEPGRRFLGSGDGASMTATEQSDQGESPLVQSADDEIASLRLDEYYETSSSTSLHEVSPLLEGSHGIIEDSIYAVRRRSLP